MRRSLNRWSHSGELKLVCSHPPPQEGDETFLCRYCGQPVAGLLHDLAFQMPDVIWELSESDRDGKAVSLGKDFWVLAPSRYFVRCLLPIPVAEDDEFSFGVWVEVRDSAFRAAFDAWDDPEAYRSIEFEGLLANRITAPGWSGFGAPVRLRVRDARLRPYVVESSDKGLKALIATGWTSVTFEQFARSLMDGR